MPILRRLRFIVSGRIDKTDVGYKLTVGLPGIVAPNFTVDKSCVAIIRCNGFR